MDTAIISRDIIARQAAAAAERSLRTKEPAQNPYCPYLQVEEHAEFERRFCIALLRHTAPVDSEGGA